MPDEAPLREFARLAIRRGMLPRREPDRTWSEPGLGAACSICERPVQPAEMKYEVEFARDGDILGLDRFSMHLRCFAVWELERMKPTTTPQVPMTTASPSPTASEALQFALTGTIATWDRFGRWLRIGERNFWLTPDVSEAGLVSGTRVTVSGHQDDLTTRWIVTQVLLT